MNSINKKELCKYLDLYEEDEIQDFFENFNLSKLIVACDKLKQKCNYKKTLNLLCSLIDYANIPMQDAVDTLLLDDELLNYISNIKKPSDKLVKAMYNSLTSVEDEEEIIDDEECDEQILNFIKYDYLKMKLELFIYSNRYKPDFEEFIHYIDNLQVDRVAKGFVKKSDDPFNVKMIGELYRMDGLEVIENIKKYPEVKELLDQLSELRDEILQNNESLVNKIANKYLNRGLPFDDLAQEGKIGLTKAINKFDYSRGNKFSTLATYWIRQSIIKALVDEGTTIRLPSHIYLIGYKVRRVKTYLLVNEGIEYPDAKKIYDTCKKLNIDLNYRQISNYLKAIDISEPYSVDKPLGDEEDASLLDFMTEKDVYTIEETVEENYEKRRKQEILNSMYSKGSKIKFNKNGKAINIANIFKRINFVCKDNSVISILLTDDEYTYYIKDAKKYGQERIIELFDKYKIDKSKLTSKASVDNLILTHEQRDVLIYRIRTDNLNEITTNFIKQRNYNNALFTVRNENYPLTLRNTGKLFDITREWVRQVETKKQVDMNLALNKSVVAKTMKETISLENKLNAFDEFNIGKKSDYAIDAPENNLIEIDSDGNIIPLNDGKINLCVKNKRNGLVYTLLLSINKKDNQ